MGGDEQLGDILDAVPASIAYIDRDQRYRWANAAYRNWMGDPRGKTVREVVGEDIYAQIRESIERVLAGETVAFEIRLVLRDGAQRWAQAHYVPDRDESNVVRGFTAQIHDISEHKQVEERLAQLVDTSRALSVLVDQDTITQTIAQSAIPLLADWSAFYVDRFGVVIPKAIAYVPALTSEETWQLARSFSPGATMQAISQDDHVVVPLFARGRRLGVLVLGSIELRSWPREDLLLADELGRRGAAALDLAKLFEQQRRANEQLKEADRRKDELLAIVGHELRNPLAPIVTALDVMEYRGLVGCERERAVIRRQALHMSRLVDDLLDVARIRRGKIALQKKPLEVHTVITKAIELTSPLLEQRNHQLTVDVPRELVIECDATRMTQVFANLLTNAAKYTPARGHITVSAQRRNESVSITVSDDGQGIAPELLAGIFEPFVQGERTLHQAEGGLGLGLALVRSLTELHGGTVQAASDGPGRGASFTVDMPLFQMVPLVPAPIVEAQGSAPIRAGSRLLLVDDNADAAHILAELLREHGFDVAVAHDAPAALLLADEFRPSIALLDIGLPVMDGYELARHLRARLPTPPRLVAVSGYGDYADATRSRDAGFDVHLAKPVDFEKLVTLLGSLEPS